MPLPTISTPTFQGTIPSTGKKFTFRPFLTGESKILLFALETGELYSVYLALRDIINACVLNNTNNKIFDVEQLPLFDLESIFIQISARSTGELAKVIVKCKMCSGDNTLEIPLLDVKLNNYDKNANKIVVQDPVGVILKYPTLQDAINLAEEAENNENSEEKKTSSDIVLEVIESVFDASNVYTHADFTKEELETFINSMNFEQIKKIKDFLKNSPYLGYSTKYTCAHCGGENSVEIKGVKNFFK